MKNYVKFLSEFLSENTETIINELSLLNPDAEKSQINSWAVLVEDIKKTETRMLKNDFVISIEFNLPIDGMSVDLLIAGYDGNMRKHVFLIESKQWIDSNIHNYQFGEYRSETLTLHPQVQVARHAIAFKDYLDIGESYQVHPYVFMRNLSTVGIDYIRRLGSEYISKGIPVQNDLNSILLEINSIISTSNKEMIDEIQAALYKPSKSIISAMESMINRHEPFILTEEQQLVVHQIFEAFKSGLKIVRITGAAGSGKTAILLHTYLKLLNKQNDEMRPIFVPGAQNTKLYQSLFPEVERSFTFSFGLDRMVGKTIGQKYYVCMDEAQHNQKGIISSMIERGAHLILCYDENQTINADNALEELHSLQSRNDFLSIGLKNSVRFSGSQVFEKNVKNLLSGEEIDTKDDCYDFRIFDSIEELETHTTELMRSYPNASVAITGLLSNDAKVIANRLNSRIFLDWGYQGECKWIPYVENKDYLSQFGGKLWVGTWWLPGLDVDYVSVIVGGDAKMTDSGLLAIPEGAKHYQMIMSIAKMLEYPDSLFVSKTSFGKIQPDSVRSTKNIIEYAYSEKSRKKEFVEKLTVLLRNNYYILLTRGRKGCFVCFMNK